MLRCTFGAPMKNLLLPLKCCEFGVSATIPNDLQRCEKAIICFFCDSYWSRVWCVRRHLEGLSHQKSMGHGGLDPDEVPFVSDIIGFNFGPAKFRLLTPVCRLNKNCVYFASFRHSARSNSRVAQNFTDVNCEGFFNGEPVH